MTYEMIYNILSYFNPNNYSNVCSLWWEIAKEQKRRDYIEKEIAWPGESREFYYKPIQRLSKQLSLVMLDTQT